MKKELNLDDIIGRAKELDSYFITVTTKDKNKDEGDLNHYAFRKEFALDDVIPSLDASVRSMGVEPPAVPNIVKPKKTYEERKPLKIAVITHFNRCPDSYSPGKAVKNQIKILRQFGHEVAFFVAEGSTLEVDCKMMPVMPKFKRQKWVVDEDAKKRLIDVFREHLNDYDLAITHDFYIDDCITYREAIKECGVKIPWLHWARSGVGRSLDFSMPNARYVYMNYADVGTFAHRIGVSSDRVRVVFNEKDPALMNQWNPITKMVSDRMRLWEKDIIQTFPICTTRMDAKGLNSVIATFGQLKRMGKSVALIVCNSNGRRRLAEIDAKVEFAERHGLTEEDFVFTSRLATSDMPIHSEVPHKVVAELMQVSNLFIFPTIAEVCSNVLLEASMSKNLLVINEDLPCLSDFVDDDAVLKHPFTSMRKLHYSGRSPEDLKDLARRIVGQLDSNKPDMQFRKVWKTHSIDSIYRNMLEPILYE